VIVILSQLVGRHKPGVAKMSLMSAESRPSEMLRDDSPSNSTSWPCCLFCSTWKPFPVPLAVILRELKMFGFWEMMVYIAIVLVGLFYVWKKGVLDWVWRR